MNQPSTHLPRWTNALMRAATTDHDLGASASRLAALRIPVFPCVPGGKQPLTPHGFQDASTSPAKVREWWRRTPDANIGIPTGRLSGVHVVDVDVHPTGSGYNAFAAARRAGIADGWSWLVTTPSGGLHAYYPIDGAGEHRSWHLPGIHVDFRGDGGYIIAPPSLVELNGQLTRYEVMAVADQPGRPVDGDRLRQFFAPSKPRPAPRSLDAVAGRVDRLADWVAARPEGDRNHGLFWAACRMSEGGHRFDQALNVLGDAAHRAGLPEREAEATIRSAYRIASRLTPPPQPGLSRNSGVARAVGL